ncbi:PAS domain-containing protein [Methylobacterium oryzihabitans]|uniref:histidine kinase n=1 Tax=Methylobacterium oryzihabitans TaxID=2499852 RepID=A0A437PFX0_9HYPH|nr:PAS domain-containing protein [Methylobacterium oryzihabitans]RVU21083.1 histidine kinase [Methylobacterium oryzihabitans]
MSANTIRDLSVDPDADALLWSSTVGHLAGAWRWIFATGEQVWSPGLFGLLGLDPGSVRPDYRLFLALVHPNDRVLAGSTLLLFRDGVLPEATIRVVRPDGAVRVLARRGRVVHSPDGRPLSAAGVMLDVTDAEALAGLRHEEQRRRRALFEQAQTWTHATAYGAAARRGSQEILRLTGLSQEAFQHDCTLVSVPDRRERMRAQVRRMLDAGRPFAVEKRLVLAGGGHGDFRFVFAPVRDERGAIEVWASQAARIGGLREAPAGRLRQGLEQGIEGRHLRAARGLLDWSRDDLARVSGLSLSTIRRLEQDGEGAAARSRHAAVAALRQAGIGFLLVDGNAVAVVKQ